MTLDEAIKYAEEVAEGQYNLYDCYLQHGEQENYVENCLKCGTEHRQLAEWLKELKQLREQTRWIPVIYRFPKDEQEIVFSTKTGRVHSGKYYNDDSANQWYSHKDKCRAWNNVVTAWMPLPEPYKEESELRG